MSKIKYTFVTWTQSQKIKLFMGECDKLVTSVFSFVLHILDGLLDGLLCQHRAVQFNWGQLQVLCDLAVLNFESVFNFHALDNLGGVGTGGDG